MDQWPQAVEREGGSLVSVGQMLLPGGLWKPVLQKFMLPTGISWLFLLTRQLPAGTCSSQSWEHGADPSYPPWERQRRQRLPPAAVPVVLGSGAESGLLLSSLSLAAALCCLSRALLG